jgi:hypothetical protein
MQRVLIILAFGVALCGCDRSKINEDKYLEAGEQAVLPFKRSLKAALVSGLQEGPTSAIAVCRTEAPKLAEKAGSAEVRVGRTSSKLRNPANVPKPWVEPLLERYESEPNHREPAVVVIDDATVGYVEPIFAQPLCVTCHGSHIEPDVQAKLNELYPEDQATGYVAGDLRGVFWAELPR